MATSGFASPFRTKAQTTRRMEIGSEDLVGDVQLESFRRIEAFDRSGPEGASIHNQVLKFLT